MICYDQAEQGEDYNEEVEREEEIEEEEEEEESPQQLIVTQSVVGDGQTYQTDGSGQVHLANINGQQVQVCTHICLEICTQVS